MEIFLKNEHHIYMACTLVLAASYLTNRNYKLLTNVLFALGYIVILANVFINGIHKGF